MSFNEISEVIPWLETTYGMGIDPQADQVCNPRVYKTHMPYDICPKGAGKYIYVCREPKDALLSMYNMVNGWIVDWSDASFYVELVMRTFWSDVIRNPNSCPIWDHIVSWFPHINDPNVLWLHYEDMKTNLPYCVELIVNFLDLGKNDKEL